MASAAICTSTLAGVAFSGTPLCLVTIDEVSTGPATANSAKCSISGTTVTKTFGCRYFSDLGRLVDREPELMGLSWRAGVTMAAAAIQTGPTLLQ